jgi:O-antigen/teichoic acid export membrane protein
MKIDQVMIAIIIGEEANGFYSAAIKLSESIYFVPALISSSFFPAILNAKKISNDLYYQRLKKLFSLLLYISLTFAVIITIKAEDIISFLFGKLYLESVGVLKIHAWSAVFVSFGVLSTKWFIAENKTKLATYRTLLGASSNIILNLVLIPTYGIKGSAFATLFSYFMAGFISDLFLKDTLFLFKIKIKSFNILNLIKKI